MGFLMTPPQATLDLNLRCELAPNAHGGVSPVLHKAQNGTWQPLGIGCEVNFPGVPLQSWGLRYVKGPFTGGTVICIIGHDSRYVGLDNFGYAIANVLRNARTICDGKYVAPRGKNGEKDSRYQKWGRRIFKMLEDNMNHWADDYSFKELAPFHKVWVFYRMRNPTRSNGFMCLGNWFVTNVDRGGEALYLRSVERPAGAPAPNLAALAGIALNIFNQMRTPPPEIVKSWASPAPPRGVSAPVLMASGGGELARPTAIRPIDDSAAQQRAHMAALDVAANAERMRSGDESQDIESQLVQFTIQDVDAAGSGAAHPDQYGSMANFMLPGLSDDVESEEGELEEGEIREGMHTHVSGESLVSPPVARDNGKAKAADRAASPSFGGRRSDGAGGYVPAGNAEESDDEDDLLIHRASYRNSKARMEMAKRRRTT